MAFPFGIVLFILFLFDANVSSLIAQDSEFPLKKHAAFHWAFFLLGTTTFISGLLGIPAPNGLLLQAPLYTASLVVLGYEDGDDHALSDVDVDESLFVPSNEEKRSRPRTNSPTIAEAEAGTLKSPRGRGRAHSGASLTRRLSHLSATVRETQQRRRELAEVRRERREVPVAAVEQRVSNLAAGLLVSRSYDRAVRARPWADSQGRYGWPILVHGHGRAPLVRC